jgi:hypothetical protein
MRLGTTSVLGAAALSLLTSCGRQAATLDAAVSMAEQPEVIAAPRQEKKAEPVSEGPFRFSDDRAGELLGELLTPSQTAKTTVEKTTEPRKNPPSALVEQPTPSLPQVATVPVLLPSNAGAKRLQPGAPVEEMPLLSYRLDPALPHAQILPAGERVRLPSRNVNQAMALPMLAQLVTDRAPLDDPTAEASLTLGLAAQPPSRTTPAPFLRLNLPEPFENRVKSLSERIEEPLPMSLTPKRP